MRNPSAYVPNFLNFQICCILSKFKTLFVPKFSISNFHIGMRARGVAAGQILPARRRSAAACIPDVIGENICWHNRIYYQTINILHTQRLNMSNVNRCKVLVK